MSVWVSSVAGGGGQAWTTAAGRTQPIEGIEGGFAQAVGRYGNDCSYSVDSGAAPARAGAGY